MTTPTQEALMALADAYADAISEVARRHHRAALASAIAELVQDAARYRWIRDPDTDLQQLAANNWGDDGDVYSGAELDAAIDAERAARSDAKKTKGE